MKVFMNLTQERFGLRNLAVSVCMVLLALFALAMPVQAQGSGGCKIGTGPVTPMTGEILSPNDPLLLQIMVSTDNTATCNHIGTGWAIATDPGFALNTLVYDSGFSSAFDLTSTTIQQPQLQPGSTYWWRAYIQVTNSGSLEWMEVKDTFTTSGSSGGGSGTPAPQIFNLSLTQGVSGDVVTVIGSGFAAGFDPQLGGWQSVVEFGGQTIPTTLVDNNTLTFTVPNNNCGNYSVQVVNPDPAILIDPVSNMTTFEIICFNPPPGAGLPTPQITSLSPSTANPGDVVSVNGSNFLDFFLGEVSDIYFDGSKMQTSFVSAGELRFTVPTLTPCGNIDVYVSTTDGQFNFVNSNTVSLNIPCGGGNAGNLPVPNIQSLSPNSGPAGTTVKVNGNNFLQTTQNIIVTPGSEILFDGNLMTTTFNSQTELEFTIPANASCGNHQVQVRTPAQALNDPPAMSNTTTFNVTSGCSGGGGGGNRGSNGTPTAKFTYSPSTVQVNQSIQFTNQSTDPDGSTDIKTITWNFGDGNTSTSSNPTHTYRTAGTFNVQLRVVDSAGNSNSATKTVTVSNTTGPGPNPGTLSVEQAIARMVPNDPNSANANAVIGDKEIKQAVTYWIMASEVPNTGGQKVTDSKILDLIKKWVSGATVTTNSPTSMMVSDAEAQYQLDQLMHGVAPRPAPFSLNAVHLQKASSERWTLRARGQGIERIQVQVFDTSGRLIINQESNGNGLTLLALDTHGNRLANGVYLYMVTVFNTRGQPLHSGIEGWVVLR